MANFNLYMSFPSDNGVWWEITARIMAEFTVSPIDEQPNSRFSWGELTIKNEPLNYLSTPANRYKLYDLIMAEDPTVRMQLKFVSAQYPDGILGYFGIVDCEPEDNFKLIKIKPTIYDDYTPLLENRETEIKLYDENNIVKNPLFALITTDIYGTPTPNNWIITANDDIFLRRGWLDNSTVAEISDDYLGMAFPAYPIYFYQVTPVIHKNQSTKFSFSYFLSGTSNKLKDLFCDVFLTDPLAPTVNYRLNREGKWSDATPIATETTPIRYDQARMPIPIASFDKYRAISIQTEKTPVAGTIEIRFYRPSDSGEWDALYKLILTNVQFSASDIELKKIKVQFSDENLVSALQGSDNIYWKNKQLSGDNYFSRVRKDSVSNQLYDYIDETTGEPKWAMLSNIDYGISSVNNLYYQNLIDIFNSDPLQKSYKYELSKLTVFRGIFRQGNKRNWYAVAEFSREESYKNDTYELDNNGNVTTILIPPAYDSEWEQTNTFSDYYNEVPINRLWVRKPFSGTVILWKRDEIVGDGTLQTYENSFDYYYSLTTSKAYPISAARSFEVQSAIDFRNLMEKTYQETAIELKDKKVYSSFFWNDCEAGGALPDVGLTGLLGLDDYPQANYAGYDDSSTGVQPRNTLNNIVAVHTYELRDAVDQKYGDENSILKLSFKKLWSDLLVMFRNQIYFFVDSSLNLHIEHLKHFDKINTPIDMDNPQFAYIRKYESWKYTKAKMYSLEEYEMKNSGYLDFKTSKVTFDQLPSNKRENDMKVSFATQYISTDVQYCKENPTSIDNGILLMVYDVVLNTETSEYENVSRYGQGQKSTGLVLNGDLSISTIHEKYGRYEGTWKQGFINEKEYPFSFTKRTIEGKEITFKGIFHDSHILNNIGRGLAISKTIDYNSLITKVLFAYRYKVYYSPTTTGDIIVITTKPIVITSQIRTIISNSSVSCGGNVTSDGGNLVTERGICYSIDQNAVTTADSKVTSGTGIGSFDCIVTGLTLGVNYYFKAYAINSNGTSYGYIGTFLISDALTVTTNTNFAILSETSILSGGNVIIQGASAVTARGMIVAFRTTFSLDNAIIITVDGSGIGVFESTIEGLIPNQTYYIKAYATNSEGTVYGNIVRVST